MDTLTCQLRWSYFPSSGCSEENSLVFQMENSCYQISFCIHSPPKQIFQLKSDHSAEVLEFFSPYNNKKKKTKHPNKKRAAGIESSKESDFKKDWVSVLEQTQKTWSVVFSLSRPTWCQTVKMTHFVYKIKIPFSRKW